MVSSTPIDCLENRSRGECKLPMMVHTDRPDAAWWAPKVRTTRWNRELSRTFSLICGSMGRVRLTMQPNVCSTWLISNYNHRGPERASGAMFLNKKPSMCMIEGKCAGLRAKTVEVSGHLPLIQARSGRATTLPHLGRVSASRGAMDQLL